MVNKNMAGEYFYCTGGALGRDGCIHSPRSEQSFETNSTNVGGGAKTRVAVSTRKVGPKDF